MKEQFKKTVMAMTALMTVCHVDAWEKMTDADKDVSVSVIKKENYVKSNTIEGVVKSSKRGYVVGGMDVVDAAINSQDIMGSLEKGLKQTGTIKSQQYTDLYLDLDADPTTAEAIATVCTDCPDIKMDVFNITNGVSTTVGKLMDLGKHECSLEHSVQLFKRSKIAEK